MEAVAKARFQGCFECTEDLLNYIDSLSEKQVGTGWWFGSDASGKGSLIANPQWTCDCPGGRWNWEGRSHLRLCFFCLKADRWIVFQKLYAVFQTHFSLELLDGKLELFRFLCCTCMISWTTWDMNINFVRRNMRGSGSRLSISDLKRLHWHFWT